MACRQAYHVEELASAPHEVDIIAEGGAAGSLAAEGEDDKAARRAQHELAQLREGGRLHHGILVHLDDKIALLLGRGVMSAQC